MLFIGAGACVYIEIDRTRSKAHLSLCQKQQLAKRVAAPIAGRPNSYDARRPSLRDTDGALPTARDEFQASEALSPCSRRRLSS